MRTYADRREYMREYQRNWVAKRRAEYFADKNCAHCGSTEKLELDHIDPNKKTNHSIWSWSIARREAELKKCQILCEKCHLAKTIKQMPITQGYKPYRHGTMSMYFNQNCKCGLCMLAGRNYQRIRRARKVQTQER